MALAFEFLEKTGLNTEANYPYTSGEGVTGKCNEEKDTGDEKVITYKEVEENKNKQLMAAIALKPVSVAIQANKAMFQNYKTGVLKDGLLRECGTKLDHGVLAVGYGTTEEGDDYILVKNSWGTVWGDKGYIKIENKEGKGTCGINMEPVYPTAN